MKKGKSTIRTISGTAAQACSDAFRGEIHLNLYLLYHDAVDREKVDDRLASLERNIAKLDRLTKRSKVRELFESLESWAMRVPGTVSNLFLSNDQEMNKGGSFDFSEHKAQILNAYSVFSHVRKLGVKLNGQALDMETEARKNAREAAQKRRGYFYSAIIVIFGCILVLGVLWIQAYASLVREIQQRKNADAALRQSEQKVQILHGQTEQLSLAAAQVISMGDKALVSQKICNAIVAYSDYQRVIISLFKDEFPFREIVGFAGIGKEQVERLRRIEFSRDWYNDVFDQGIPVGRCSYYIPQTMKHLLNQEATCFGKGPVPEKNNAWHPEDNLFVRMNDEKGEFIGVISVDDSKSGEIPSARTIRPLEIFSSLISQIIILKREQERREKMEAQLNQAVKMESIGTLAGGIAHDFNNILGIILGNTELGLGKIANDHPSHKNLSEIKNASLRAADIVRQLLSFSSKTEPVLNPIDIVPLIHDTLKFMRSSIPSTVDIKQMIIPKMAVVMADPVQINRILMNLCINAFQAMPDEKGVIEVTARVIEILEKDALSMNGVFPGFYLRIRVSDSGQGIDPDILDRIFDPYFTTKDVGKGSGMGLSVVVGIVKAHNGEIQVDSTPGQGSQFSVYLPLVFSPPQNLSEGEKKIPGPGHEHILFVDDDPAITDMYATLLNRLGYRTKVSNHPLKALALFKAAPDQFDLVITDMTMPSMTGAELAKAILDITKDLPIIICTGHSDLLDEAAAIELGVAAYVTKPITCQKMASTIRQVLESGRSSVHP
ncbi:MAG: response regulator [Desulfobacter sp.]|nr:MAG: response regulator [Desulfobacter sp.]